MRCPRCGNPDIIMETDVPVRFRLSKYGNIEIVSYHDVIDKLEQELKNGYIGKSCPKCGYHTFLMKPDFTPKLEPDDYNES